MVTNFQPLWAFEEDGVHVTGGQIKRHQTIGEHVRIYVL